VTNEGLPTECKDIPQPRPVVLKPMADDAISEISVLVLSDTREDSGDAKQQQVVRRNQITIRRRVFSRRNRELSGAVSRVDLMA